MKRTAVILFNLGGPDSLAAVKPFLFNLFNDKAIISLKQPIRYCLAKLISSKREKIAQGIYSHIGGKSPILEETKKQVDSLELLLNEQTPQQVRGDIEGVWSDNSNICGDREYKTFIAMRYWHPMTEQAAQEIQRYTPDEIVLLPLYPQFSTTTTGSSINKWQEIAKKTGLDKIPTRIINNYHDYEPYIEAQAKIIEAHYNGLEDKKSYRILFSAHGLPQKIADLEDEPYPQQIQKTVELIINKMQENGLNIDYKICYQSRVGRLKWIDPSTEDEIQRAADDGKNLLIVPIAFTSEHSETLVELDIEYKELAENLGIKDYQRVKTLGNDKLFIKALADLVQNV